MSFPPYTNKYHTSSYPGIDPTRPELSTSGKTVLITGGGSGIGRRIVHAFATSGSTKIAILGRTESNLLTTKEEVEKAHPGVTVLTVTADVGDESDVNKAFEKISKVFGKLDILISNAGYLPDINPIKDVSVDEWFKGMIINVKGNLLLAKAFLVYGSTAPTFVHISTGIVHIPPMLSNSGYAISKLAAAKLMDYFAAENPHVRVHNVHPGVIKTEMNAKAEGLGFDFNFDDVELPASFAVWIVSPEAEFLKGRFVWSNWDIEELKAKKEHLASTDDLTLGLLGWP